MIEKAISYDFLICSDECYVDIYESSTEPPIGILECEDITLPKSKSVVFHSLSKRSNLAGLRSGFVSAGEEVIEKLGLYRTYHGVTLPIPSQIASEWAWKDRKHVEENRQIMIKNIKLLFLVLSRYITSKDLREVFTYG